MCKNVKVTYDCGHRSGDTGVPYVTEEECNEGGDSPWHCRHYYDVGIQLADQEGPCPECEQSCNTVTGQKDD